MSDSKTLQTVPSIEATYSDQKTFGVIAGRSHVEISPKYGGIFNPGDIIRLEIPAQAYLDPNEFYISFKTSIIAGAGNTADVDPAAPNEIPAYNLDHTNQNRLRHVMFVPGIQCIFNRVRLLAGSVVLEDIQDYSTLYRMLAENLKSLEYRRSDGFTNEGLYDPEDFQQCMENAAFHSPPKRSGAKNPGHVYCVRPLFGLLAAGKYIPLKYMGQLTIELYLEHPSECLWSSTSITAAAVATTRQFFGHTSTTGIPTPYVDTDLGTHLAVADSSKIFTDFPNATYQLDQVRMHVPFIHPIESFDQAMMRQIEAGDVAIFHSSWSSHTRQIGSADRVSISFQERALSLKGALACMRNSPDIRSISSDISFPANGIQAYQWKIGSEYIPAQEIKCIDGGGQALAQLRQGLGLYDNDQILNNVRQDNFLPIYVPAQLNTADFGELRRGASQPSNFFMALDLEKSSGQASGFDSAASSVDIELFMTLKKHHEVVGPTDGDRLFTGAAASADLQPSKIRVNLPMHNTLNSTVSNPSTGEYFEYFLTDTALSGTTGYTKSLPPKGRSGFMIDKSLTYVVTDSAEAAFDGAFAVTPSTSKAYSRVYFFAHIDQVLRLSAVGRMEIVR